MSCIIMAIKLLLLLSCLWLAVQDLEAALALPKLKPVLSTGVRRQLEKRFGTILFQKIHNLMTEWYRRRNERRSTSLTRNQMAWFATLARAPTISRRKKRSASTRREYRQLTASQRRRFHNAVKAMKNTLIGGMSQYDIMVFQHHPSQSSAAHGGAAFLPWHRQYLTLFENALQAHNPSVTLPYWDSTLDRYLPDPKDSIMWSNSFMGDQSGSVTTGPFSNWQVIPSCQIGGSTILRRNVGGVSVLALLDDSDYNNVMSLSSYQDLVTSSFESAHGGPHMYVGGQMGQITCSPSDPIFWMHHAFIDRIWEDFRQNEQTTSLENEYPTQSATLNIGGTLHNPLSEMKPFGPLVNKDGLSNDYTNDEYKYTPRPFSCRSDGQCGAYLFCHNRRCKSKVKRNGNCAGLYPNTRRACECGASCKLSGGSYKCICGWLRCIFCRIVG